MRLPRLAHLARSSPRQSLPSRNSRKEEKPHARLGLQNKRAKNLAQCTALHEGSALDLRGATAETVSAIEASANRLRVLQPVTPPGLLRLTKAPLSTQSAPTTSSDQHRAPPLAPLWSFHAPTVSQIRIHRMQNSPKQFETEPSGQKNGRKRRTEHRKPKTENKVDHVPDDASKI